MDSTSAFRLDGKVAIITGGAGLLGTKHAEAVAEAGGIPVLWDINAEAVTAAAQRMGTQYDCSCLGDVVDITSDSAVAAGLQRVLGQLGRVDILINNAANDPKVKPGQKMSWARLENLPMDVWSQDIAVGLTGSFLCSKHIGEHMARNGGGVILNVASDLGVIAPDQRLYRHDGLAENEQPVKPVTYSVVKHALVGLTKYLATYWADKNVRVNAISPGGVFNGQPDAFVAKLSQLIPMGRMAHVDEYKGPVLFLVSDASAYMTGANLIVDGGRTCW